MDTWYFAYGSNLWIDQMIARTGAIGHPDHPPRVVCLENHRLVFQPLEIGGSAYANILAPGDGVVGVAYRCSEADLEKLDRFEGGYDRQPVAVSDQHGDVLAAVAYVIKPALAITIGKPSAEYLKKIVTGARQHGLPEEYIRGVVAMANS
jgi:gamma-glutamylcyclotransferase